jgi:hypothetical protein
MSSLSTITTAWLGVFTGSLGLALGLWNAWRSQGVRVKVQPEISRTAASRFTVRITNLSPFSVTIERVYLVCGDDAASAGKLDLIEAGSIDRRLPIELTPRTAIVMTMSMQSTIYASMGNFRRAVAETACGKIVQSSIWHRFRGKKLGEILADAPSRQGAEKVQRNVLGGNSRDPERRPMGSRLPGQRAQPAWIDAYAQAIGDASLNSGSSKRRTWPARRSCAKATGTIRRPPAAMRSLGR